jgi:hypothetical protein
MLYPIWYTLLLIRTFSVPFDIHPGILSALIHFFLLFDLCIAAKSNNYRITRFLLFAAIYYFCLTLLYNNASITLFDIFLGCCLLKDIDLTKFFVFKLSIELVYLLVLFSALVFGFVSDEIVDLAYKGSGSYHTLGFSNTNTTSMVFWNVILSLYYLGLKLKNSFMYILGIVISVVVYNYTKGRTFLFMEAVLFFTGLLFCLKNSGRLIKKIKPLLLALPFFLIFLLGVFVAFIKYSKNQLIGLFINGIFSYRFGYFSESLDLLNPLNILVGFNAPSEITINGYTKELIIDQSYIRLFFYGGIVTVFILLYFYIRFMTNSMLYKNKILVPIILTITIGGFVESLFSSFNTSSLIYWTILFRSGNLTGVPLPLRKLRRLS